MAFPAPVTELHSPTVETVTLSTAYIGTWYRVVSPGMISINTDDTTIGGVVKVQIGEDGTPGPIPWPANGQWWHEYPKGTVLYFDIKSNSGTPAATINVGG